MVAGAPTAEFSRNSSDQQIGLARTAVLGAESELAAERIEDLAIVGHCL
jgi:hypothetical protein